MQRLASSRVFVTNNQSVKLVQKREMLLQRADGAVLPRHQRGTRKQRELFAVEVDPHRQSVCLQLLGERKKLGVARTRRTFLIEIGSCVEAEANRMTLWEAKP